MLAASLFVLVSVGPSSVFANTGDIKSDDIIADLNPDLLFRDQKWSRINCIGQYIGIRELAATVRRADQPIHYGDLRFGKVSDPHNKSRQVFAFVVDRADELTAGAKRCEVLAPADNKTFIPRDQTVWYAFRVFIRCCLGVKVGRVIISQWHVHGFNPVLSFVIDSGRIRVTVRHSTDAQNRIVTTDHLWVSPTGLEDQWIDFVVRAELSENTVTDQHIQLWFNGVKVVNRQGPFGYNTEAAMYPRIGIYHWMNDNAWDEGFPARVLLVSRAVLVVDRERRYTESAIRDLLFH